MQYNITVYEWNILHIVQLAWLLLTLQILSPLPYGVYKVKGMQSNFIIVDHRFLVYLLKLLKHKSNFTYGYVLRLA